MRIKWWKVAGLAGVVGVAATGVLVARAERQRRAYSPEEIRDRLRTRHAGTASSDAAGGAGAAGGPQAKDGTSPGSRTSAS